MDITGKSCVCPPDATDLLDEVTITGHQFPCPNGNKEGPRWYVWQRFDMPACLEAGTLYDFARAWAVHWHDTHVAGTAIAPIEVRTWHRTYRLEIVEQSANVEERFGTYRFQVEEESVVEGVGLAEPART
ncbi:hypothetical protein [Actinomadura sp. WMMA1423]|uniref:hypothetical protein n=1 Tax=Actinomadura sp. WMMA1423 TaxID=2591108 RepID=UPI00114734F2|nr:hypothetical protein [Actinomadura sp. WMMA1423]